MVAVVYIIGTHVIESFTKSIKSVYDNQSVSSSSALSGKQVESKKKMPAEIDSFIRALEKLKDNNQKLLDNNKELDTAPKGAMNALLAKNKIGFSKRPAPVSKKTPN